MGSDPRVAVIGGGISGVLVARELATYGCDVTLVDRAHIGAGSSSRTAAGIRQQFSTPGSVVAMRYAIDFYDNFEQHVGSKSPVLERSGYLFLYDDADRWEAAKKVVDMQHRVGLAEVEALENGALTGRFGFVDGEVCLGGTWCPTDGFLHPSTIYQDGARRARQFGAEIWQNAEVIGAEKSNGRLTAVLTTKGRIEADYVIDCTNAWTVRTARLLGATELPVSPLKRYLWFVSRDGSMTAEDLSGMPLVVSPSGVYGRPENPDTLLMGFGHKALPEPDFSMEDQDRVDPAFSHDTGLESKAFDAWAQFATAIPAIGEFGGVTATAGGYYGTTPDHNPFFGFDPAVANLIRLVGFSGHGAMFGPFTARVAAVLVAAGRNVDDIEVPQGVVDLSDFALGRAFDRPEALVI